MSDHLRSQRHDLHELLLPQLAAHRAEDAGRARLALIGDQHRGVLVEPDVGAVAPLRLLGRPHDHRLGDLALLDLPGRDGVLDRDHHHVPQARVAALRAAQHADHERFPRARVVRDLENRFLLHHVSLPVTRQRARSTISTTRHRLIFDSGRVSSIRTRSPAFAPCSSCACTRLVRTTCLPYSPWANRRTSDTVTVFCILSLTTTPVRTLRRPLMSPSSARAAPCGSAPGRAGSSAVAAGCRSPPWPAGTPGGTAPRRASRACARAPPCPAAAGRSPSAAPSQRSSCLTNFVRTGSFAAARSSASFAVAASTPSTSNSTRPGFTTATHASGLPLPFPIRVSAGFLVIGLSGNSRIHTLPPRFISRVSATRAASIWRFEIQPGSRVISP